MKRLIILPLLLPLAGAAFAASPPSPSSAGEPAAAMAATQRELATLQTRMNELAQRMAELSARLGDEANASALRYLADSRRGMLGLAADTAAGGWRVVAVTPGGPAERAGVRAGDLITAVDGKPADRGGGAIFGDDLMAGKPVTLSVLRGGKTLELRVTPERFQMGDWQALAREASRVAERDAARAAQQAREATRAALQGSSNAEQASRTAREAARQALRAARDSLAEVESPGFGEQIQRNLDAALRQSAGLRADIAAGVRDGSWQLFAPWWGLNLAPLNPGLGRYFGTDRGVLVLSSDAKRYPGLEAGDVITAVNGSAVTRPEDVMRALRAVPGDKAVRLALRRHGRRVALDFKVPPRQAMLPPLPPVPPAPPAPPQAIAPPPPPPVPPSSPGH